MTMQKLAPVLVVDAIEPCLPFWEALGFTRAVEAPEGDGLGFVILAKDDVTVMYQSRSSVKGDIPALAGERFLADLYIEVDDLDAIERALPKASRVIPRRTTDYGAEEVWLRDPAGNVVGFSRSTGGGG
jgi:hypothetical protein